MWTVSRRFPDPVRAARAERLADAERDLAAEEAERADQAEAEAAASPSPLKEVLGRAAAAHRRAATVHRRTAALHQHHADRERGRRPDWGRG